MSSPLVPCGHPAVIELLNHLLPEKRVVRFSFDFPLHDTATMTAVIQLLDEDAFKITEVVKKYDLQVDPESERTIEDEDQRRSEAEARGAVPVLDKGETPNPLEETEGVT